MWTGFYSTRPQLKFEIRRFIDAFAALRKHMIPALIRYQDLQGLMDSIQMSEDLMGVLLHHDAITGTCKAEVAKNYFELIDRGML